VLLANKPHVKLDNSVIQAVVSADLLKVYVVAVVRMPAVLMAESVETQEQAPTVCKPVLKQAIVQMALLVLMEPVFQTQAYVTPVLVPVLVVHLIVWPKKAVAPNVVQQALVYKVYVVT
jgi:hypothetical protein